MGQIYNPDNEAIIDHIEYVEGRIISLMKTMKISNSIDQTILHEAELSIREGFTQLHDSVNKLSEGIRLKYQIFKRENDTLILIGQKDNCMEAISFVQALPVPRAEILDSETNTWIVIK